MPLRGPLIDELRCTGCAVTRRELVNRGPWDRTNNDRRDQLLLGAIYLLAADFLALGERRPSSGSECLSQSWVLAIDGVLLRVVARWFEPWVRDALRGDVGGLRT